MIITGADRNVLVIDHGRSRVLDEVGDLSQWTFDDSPPHPTETNIRASFSRVSES